MAGKKHSEYAKLEGEPPKRDKPAKNLSWLEKIVSLVKGRKVLEPNKTHEYILNSRNIWGSVEETKNIFLKELSEHLKQNPDEVNQSRLFYSYRNKEHRDIGFYPGSYFFVFRTPLELAIERNAPIEVIMCLLENGAEPSNTSCSMATLHIYGRWKMNREDLRNQEECEKIIELLSFAGANWSSPCGNFAKIVEKDHPSGGISTPLANFIVEVLGDEKAFEIGVGATQNTPYEINLDEFAEKVKNFRVKRSKDKKCEKQVQINEEIELLIPEKSKERWSSR